MEQVSPRGPQVAYNPLSLVPTMKGLGPGYEATTQDAIHSLSLHTQQAKEPLWRFGTQPIMLLAAYGQWAHLEPQWNINGMWLSSCLPYSRKFLRGPNFRDFRDPSSKRENKNRENKNRENFSM